MYKHQHLVPSSWSKEAPCRHGEPFFQGGNNYALQMTLSLSVDMASLINTVLVELLINTKRLHVHARYSLRVFNRKCKLQDV